MSSKAAIEDREQPHTMERAVERIFEQVNNLELVILILYPRSAPISIKSGKNGDTLTGSITTRNVGSRYANAAWAMTMKRNDCSTSKRC